MPPPKLSGGALNAALANELGRLIADFTGRGAQRSRAFLHQDMVICLLEDGATSAEKNLVAAGKADLVRQGRDALQHAMAPQLVAAVESLTRRSVRSFSAAPTTPVQPQSRCSCWSPKTPPRASTPPRLCRGSLP